MKTPKQFKHFVIQRDTTLDGLKEQRNDLAKKHHTGGQADPYNQEIMREVNQEYTNAMMYLDDLKKIIEAEPYAKEQLCKMIDFILDLKPIQKYLKKGSRGLIRIIAVTVVDITDAVWLYNKISNLFEKKL